MKKVGLLGSLKRANAGILGMSLLIALFLYNFFTPFLFNGYYTDNALNSQLPIKLDRLGVSVWQFMYQATLDWIAYAGRFFPLTFLSCHGFYVLFPNLLLARGIHLLIVFSCLYFFSYLVYQWSRSRALALLMVPFFGLVVECRSSFDPISGFPGLLQAVFLFGLGALYLQLKFIRKIQMSLLGAALFLLFCGLLTYEATLIFVPLFVILPWVRTKSLKKTAWASLPYLVLTALYLGFCLYLRTKKSNQYDAIQAVFHSRPFLNTFWMQAASALPLSRFYYLAPGTFMGILKESLHSVSTYLAVLSGMILTYLGIEKARLENTKEVRVRADLVVLGICLWLFPSALIGLSKKWQESLSPGEGYLPLFISYFGVMVLLGISVVQTFKSSWMANRPKWVRITLQALLSVGCGGILLIHHTLNQKTVLELDKQFLFPRLFLEKAYEQDLASSVIEPSHFISTNSFSWNNEDLSRKISHKMLSIIYLPEFDAKSPQDIEKLFKEKAPHYIMSFGMNSDVDANKGGWALLARVNPQKKVLPKSTKDIIFEWTQGVLYLDQVQKAPDVMVLSCSGTKMKLSIPVPKSGPDIVKIPLSSFECKLESLKVN